MLLVLGSGQVDTCNSCASGTARASILERLLEEKRWDADADSQVKVSQSGKVLELITAQAIKPQHTEAKSKPPPVFAFPVTYGERVERNGVPRGQNRIRVDMDMSVPASPTRRRQDRTMYRWVKDEPKGETNPRSSTSSGAAANASTDGRISPVSAADNRQGGVAMPVGENKQQDNMQT